MLEKEQSFIILFQIVNEIKLPITNMYVHKNYHYYLLYIISQAK